MLPILMPTMHPHCSGTSVCLQSSTPVYAIMSFLMTNIIARLVSRVYLLLQLIMAYNYCFKECSKIYRRKCPKFQPWASKKKKCYLVVCGVCLCINICGFLLIFLHECLWFLAYTFAFLFVVSCLYFCIPVCGFLLILLYY